MHDTNETERVVLHNGEIVPRFARLLPNSLVVEEGDTFTLPSGDSTFDAVEVAGHLIFPRTGNTRLITTHMLVIAGGHLDMGTEEDPITGHAEIVFRDVPLDLARDPWQWGNGLVNLGRQSRVGLAKTTFTELVNDAAQGASSITVADASGWQVGDELVLPDTRQIIGGQQEPAPIRRDPKTVITGIAGNVIAISPALGFERNAILDPDGGLVLRPRVANLTRNVVIRSENPAGTRGHTANIGHLASWDIRYNQFVGVGRTTFRNLHNTSADGSVIGTNQIGKYASHDHHTGSSLAVRQHIGNSYQGTGGSKWAHVVHGTHDTLAQDNVAVDFQGGFFVTEDGWEVRNVFRHNFGAYAIGTGQFVVETVTGGNNAPGAEGSGFWFRGLHNIIEGNEAWNCENGINLFHNHQIGMTTPVPSVKGGVADTVLPERVTPISFVGNITASNSAFGLDYWSVNPYPARDHVSANNRVGQIQLGGSQGTYGEFHNPTLVAQDGVGFSILTAHGYIQGVEVNGGRMVGSAVGIPNAGAKQWVIVRDVTMQNVMNLQAMWQPDKFVHENVTHVPYKDHPPIYINFGVPAWDGVNSHPNTHALNPFFSTWWFAPNDPSLHMIRNWQGTGKDYYLLDPNQRASALAWPALDPGTKHFSPELGTMGQLWEKYRFAYRGLTVPDEHAESLVGLDHGYALAVDNFNPTAPCTPLTVMTYPNALVPAVPDEHGGVPLGFTLTCRWTDADHAYASVDGGETLVMGFRGGTEPGSSVRGLGYGTSGTPGWHLVRTWRQDGDTIIAGSERNFCYGVADASGLIPGPRPIECGTNEPPPPTPVHCVQGPWTVQSVGEWSAWTAVNNTQEQRSRIVTDARVTITQPANGGNPCGPSTQTRTEIETRPIVVPVPINCVQGDWTVVSVSEWSAWVSVNPGTEQRTRTVTETRETLTQPANGGTPCGPSSRTRTETETRTVPTVTWVTVFLVQKGSDGNVRVIPVNGANP